MLRHWLVKKAIQLFLILICILSCFPVVILFIGSLTGEQELTASLRGVLYDKGASEVVLFPLLPTIRGYVNLLLDTPEFYVVFLNSVKITMCITVGQLLVAVPAAWGFSRWHSRVSSILFYLYTLLMLLPFQVTMLSNYIVLDKVGMLDTHAAVILPAVFSTYSVFIIYRFFVGLPEDIFEAFSLESSSRIQKFLYIGIPLAVPGIKAAALLSVVEYWNMIEQPLVFLKNPSLWPFSIYLPELKSSNVQYIFVFSFMVLIPMILVIILGKDNLEKGIGTMIIKE